MPTAKKPIVKKPTVKKVVTKAVKAVPKKVAVKAHSTSSVKELPKETGLKISVYSITGKVLESVNLPKEIFGLEGNDALMTQAVRVYLANQRRGTLKKKSRGEVNISTRKIYRQKGTGRARHGAASAPIFVGGGVAFGPRQRDFSMKLTQKAKKLALFSSLSARLKDGAIRVVSGLEKQEAKTKLMAEVLSKLQLNNNNSSLLLVTPKTGKDFENVTKAARNIEGLEIIPSNLLNTYAVLKSKNILLMKDSINALKENFIKEK